MASVDTLSKITIITKMWAFWLMLSVIEIEIWYCPGSGLPTTLSVSPSRFMNYGNPSAT